MREVADLIRLHGSAYRARFAERLSPHQGRVLRDLKACRTAYFGGHLQQCSHCRSKRYTYHSCGNRHCPKCQGKRAQRWIERQQQRLLPCSYYLLTFTLPHPLRPLALKHPRTVYGALLRGAASALQKLATDPRYVGGRLGCVAVLHTWTRALRYHPHVHLLVTAGGLSSDGTQWLEPKNPAFLVPVRALSILFRAHLCAALKKADLLASVPTHVWKKNWVVHCQPAARGQKVLAYLGRYLFRVALANSRLEHIDSHQVTFRFRDNRSQQMRRLTLSGLEFLRRFLLHVLPPRWAKLRYYGLFSASCQKQLHQARALLTPRAPTPHLSSVRLRSTPSSSPLPAPVRCPFCRLGLLLLIEVLPPQRWIPP